MSYTYNDSLPERNVFSFGHVPEHAVVTRNR